MTTQKRSLWPAIQYPIAQLLHGYCTGTYTEVTALLPLEVAPQLPWSTHADNSTEKLWRYSIVTASYFKGTKLLLLSRYQCSNCAIGYCITGNNNLNCVCLLKYCFLFFLTAEERMAALYGCCRFWCVFYLVYHWSGHHLRSSWLVTHVKRVVIKYYITPT